MLIDNEAIWIPVNSVNAHFCNSLFGLNWNKKALTLSAEEESPSGLLLFLLNVCESYWCIPQLDIVKINKMIDHVYTL